MGPYGLSPFPPFLRRGGPQVFAAAPRAAASNAAAAPSPPQAGVDFSETNVQVEGVDEPDIVKTDGTRVYTVRGDTFFVVDVTDGGGSGKASGKIKLPTFPSEMLIDKNRVLVISRSFGKVDGGLEDQQQSADKSFIIRPFRQPALTIIYQIRVGGRKPRLLSTLRMEGSYVSSREVDGTARIIMRFDGSQKIPFLNPIRPIPFPRPIPVLQESRPAAAAPVQPDTNTEPATEKNKQLIRKTTIKTWLPRYHLIVECSKQSCKREHSGFITDCDDVFIPEKFTGFGLLTVATLKISSNLKPRNGVSIASDSGDVYSTATSLYVATTQYRFDFPTTNSLLIGRDFKTSIHKFRLNPFGATYRGSGDVSGSVLNQFSMHENGDVFYVATTEGAAWWASRDTSKSKVTSFRNRKRKLVQVGEVGNLGIGERIFAVRYIGAVGYVVTFRQIDPLYILDLSNPSKLRVTGELKIPGFSSYLHPVGQGRLLGVGQQATEEGRTTGAKVSLFDVSDVTKPREISAWVLTGGFSSAQFDHRAFLFWEPESVAVLPVSVFSSNVKERFTGSIVLKVTESQIVERGRISHKIVRGSFAPSIQRNFVLGRKFLWSLSAKLLQINGISDLSFVSDIDLEA